MKRAIIILCWISIIAAGVFLRFDELGKRSLHADEATGARITANRMEAGEYRFDPVHFHGPIMSSLAIPICEIRGETRWKEMTKLSLRILPAVTGCLLLLVPLIWRGRFGDWPMLLAAALMCTTPLLVYYSRMYIHEMLLTLFGMLALCCLIRFPRYGIPGLLIALMYAAKESFAISIIAWSAAALLVAFEKRRSMDREWLLATWKSYRMPVLLSFLAAGLVSLFSYTDGFRHPAGALDAVKTFFIYKTGEGHDKPFFWYLDFLTIPVKSGGLWWYGTPVMLLALIALASSFRRDSPSPALIRFVAWSAVGHFVIYGMIAYKTPWLACLPWAHVCLLAGLSLAGFHRHHLPVKVIICLLATGAVYTQFKQARHATGRYASDARNPFAYVPTRQDIETLGPWLDQLRAAAPEITVEPLAIVGTEYWPLPWYLRSFEKIGYWPKAPDHLADHAIVISTPDATESVLRQLEATHIPLPRGLRTNVPIHVFVSKELWDRWMNNDDS